MYLSDIDLKAKLSSMEIASDNAEFPFDPSQIQPCSIDLRISNVFWKTTSKRPIDLRKARLLELEPRLYWEKKILNKGDTITLKPGESLFARVSEKFSVPLDCAGKIEGRSSFARMGLGIHFTGDFINPGYRGHMPLQLFNYSNRAIVIIPYIPICQLMLIKLSCVPSRGYGDRELQSKYMDDDGGPSYWWRDKRIKQLQEKFNEVDLSVNIQERLLEKIGIQEPETIVRFQDYMAKVPRGNLENADEVLESFSKFEDQAKKREKIVFELSRALFPLAASISLGLLFVSAYGVLHYLFWAITLISLPPFFHSLHSTPLEYLGTAELKKLKRATES